MDNKEDFLQHWGIKGMKWKDTKSEAKMLSEKERLAKAAEVAKEKEYGLTKLWGYSEDGKPKGSVGYVDRMGNEYPHDLDEAVKLKKEYDKEIVNMKNYDQKKKDSALAKSYKEMANLANKEKKAKGISEVVSLGVRMGTNKQSELLKTLKKNEDLKREKGKSQEGPLSRKKALTKAHEARVDFAKKENRISMTSSLRNVSGTSVKKGKAFLDRLFGRGNKRTPANETRKQNNSSPM
jgi:hypothetical protein